MQNISARLTRADQRGLIGPRTINARFKAAENLTHAPRRTGDDLADALAEVFTPTETPLTAVKAIRQSVKAAEAEAAQIIEGVAADAATLKAVAAYIAGETDTIPADDAIPDHIRSSLVTLKAAQNAGITVAPGLAAEVRHLADETDRQVDHHRKLLALRSAASRVALGKQGAAFMAKAAKNHPEKYGIFSRSERRFLTLAERAKAQHTAARRLLNGGHDE